MAKFLGWDFPWIPESLSCHRKAWQHQQLSEIADKLFSKQRGSPKIRLMYAKRQVNKDMRLKQAIARLQ